MRYLILLLIMQKTGIMCKMRKEPLLQDATIAYDMKWA